MTKILIIEDDPQIIATMTATLQKWQYQVATVQDWQHVAQRVDETVALVLCDITLPSFDGFYWIQTIRQTSAVPIIVISAAAIDDNVMHVVAAGAGLATICLLCSAVMVLLFGSLSLYVGRSRIQRLWNPAAIQVVTPLKQRTQAHQTVVQLADQQGVAVRRGRLFDYGAPVWKNHRGKVFDPTGRGGF